MTQAYVLPFLAYVASGADDTFAYPWRIGLATDLDVYLDGVLTSAYTVTGVNAPTGGTIVFTTPPAANTVVVLRRDTPQTQLLDYIDNDPFGAETHEAALDKLTRLVQELGETLSRVPQLAVTTLGSLRNLLLPAPGAGRLFGWNGLGTALMLYDPTVLQTVPGRLFGTRAATLTAVDGASVLTAAGLLPAGSRISAVLYQCTSSFGATRGLTSVDVGESLVQDRWGTAIGITTGTATGYGYGIPGDLSVLADTDVLVTANGGLFDATGACVVTAFWETLTV